MFDSARLMTPNQDWKEKVKRIAQVPKKTNSMFLVSNFLFSKQFDNTNMSNVLKNTEYTKAK